MANKPLPGPYDLGPFQEMTAIKWGDGAPPAQTWSGRFNNVQTDWGEQGTPDQGICDSNRDFRAGYSTWGVKWQRTDPPGTPTVQDWLANIAGKYWQGQTSGLTYRAGGDPGNVWCTRGTLEQIWTTSYAAGSEWLSVAWVAFFNQFFEEVDYPTPFVPTGWVNNELLIEVPPP